LSWDKSEPTSATKVKDADDYIRGNWAAFATAIGREHEATSSASSGEELPGRASVVAIDVLSAISGVSGLSNLDGAIGFATDVWDFLINDGSEWYRARQIESGTVCFFFQSTAPSGWTVVTSLHDRLINVAAAGGSTGGSWTVTASSTENHTHTYTGVPSHAHSYTLYLYTGSFSAYKQLYFNNNTQTNYQSWNSTYAGDANPTTDSVESETISGDSVWRPAGCNFIVCSKD